MRPLRGRAAECAALNRLVTAVADGAGATMIIEGAAGIGKSRLITAALSMATRVGVRVAEAAAEELDQVTPWAPLLRSLQSASPPLLGRADLAPLKSLADQRLAVIERIRAALEEASSRRPLLIAIDDMQWADPATLMALAYLPVQLFSYPVAWIFAARQHPTSSQYESLIGRLADSGATRIRLGPLNQGASRALAADYLGSEHLAGLPDLIEQAGGNPFYIVELLRGATSSHAQGLTSLREAMSAHLRALPDAATNLLKVASVLGRAFSVSELAATTGQRTGQMLPALQEALLSEVLIEDDQRLVFRHDLLRQAIYSNLPWSLRQALHRDAGAALKRSGAPLARVASQFAAGAQPGDEDAIEVLGAAATQLLATSPSAAADFGLRAIGLLPAADPRAERLTAMTAEALGLAGRLEEARTLGEAYLAEHEPAPSVEAAIILGIRRAWTMHSLRPYPSPLPAQLAANPRVPAGMRASLVALDQLASMGAGDFAAADRGFESAMRQLTPGADATDAATVFILWVLNASMTGDLLLALERARTGLDGWGKDDSTLATSIFRHDVAQSLGSLGRSADALAALDLAAQSAEKSGFSLITSMCQQRRAEFLLERGQVEDARAEAKTAAASAETMGFLEVLALALAVLAECCILQGDLAEAEAAIGRLERQLDGGTVLPERAWAQALCLDGRDRPVEALEVLAPTVSQLSHGCLIFASRQADRLPWLVHLALRAGDSGQAAAVAKAAGELARRNPGARLFAATDAHARGLLGTEPALLETAVGLLAECEWPLATAAAREDLAQALTEQNRREQAVEQLEAAYASYVECNAHRSAARARRALRDLGVRKPRTAAGSRADNGNLTSAELAVVRIVAQGRTNKEAAAQLFVSPDTINTHLKHAFAKLGVRSRVELARLPLPQ